MTALGNLMRWWLRRPSAPPPPHASLRLTDTLDSSRSRASEASEIGTLPSGYTYLRPHRQGGLGTILVVREERSGREVALKRLHADLRGDPLCRGLIEGEARLTARLQHPNIVPVYDMGVDSDGHFYYTMRLVPGRTLDEYLESLTSQRSSLPTSQALRRLVDCLRKVCDAVMYAHARGVLHLDLKPSNILVGDFGEVLLVDWGCAARVTAEGGQHIFADAQSRPTPDADPGLVGAGTPARMAPEQFNADRTAVDTETDVYQLGGILYEILTLSPPEVWWRRQAHRSDSRQGLSVNPLVRGYKRSVGGPLAAMCQRALASDPHERYSSVGDFAADIDRWFADAPVTAYREGFIERCSRLVRGHPRAGAAIAASAALVVVFNLQLLRVTTQGYGQTLASLVAGQGRASVGGVSALRGLFESRAQVPDPAEFQVLSDLYQESYPGISAHSWVPRVEAEQRSSFVNEVRASAASAESPFATFTVTERGANQAMVPAAARDTYYPVRYIEPYDGNEEAIGFDLGSVDNRRRMLTTARLREGISLSGLLSLVQAGEGQAAFLAAAAVRDPGAALGDPVRGYITGVVRLQELLAFSWRDIETDYLTVRVYDVTDPGSPVLMWTNERGAQPPAAARNGPATGLFSSQSELTLFDRRWSVWVRPRAAFLWYYPLAMVRR